jgi:phosphatidylglycerophosphate synthase
MKINPSHVTGTRFFVLIAFFFLWINQEFIAAVMLLLLNWLLDGIDGDLARMKRVDSDLGKFEDVTADNFMVVILPLALTWQGLISGFTGAYYIFIVSLSWWFSVLRLNQKTKSTWIIKPQAAGLLHIPRFWTVTLLMFAYAFWHLDIFQEVIIILSVLLTYVVIQDYYQLIKRRSGASR